MLSLAVDLKSVVCVSSPMITSLVSPQSSCICALIMEYFLSHLDDFRQVVCSVTATPPRMDGASRFSPFSLPLFHTPLISILTPPTSKRAYMVRACSFLEQFDDESINTSTTITLGLPHHQAPPLCRLPSVFCGSSHECLIKSPLPSLENVRMGVERWTYKSTYPKNPSPSQLCL